MKEISLFVPGRLSILGGLSDLTSPYLSKNADIKHGMAIACGINKGIYAKVKKSSQIEFKMKDKEITLELNKEKLLAEAQSGSFYSYMAGTVYYLLDNVNNIEGISIEITKMDLPIKKGLASSAAICILVVKAYNELYDLNLSITDIQEFAYEGEHIALSKCGRLDQVCALGKDLVKIDFYEHYATTTRINAKEELNFIIADLNGKKDTRKIMKGLNDCFPFAKDDKQKVVHEVLGEKNQILVKEAQECIENGNKKRLGEILNEIQELIDRMSVVCDEFKAPILHKTLADEHIKSLSYGGKGIGSGGDGTIQILAKDRQSQEELIHYLNDELKMDAFAVNIK